MFIFTKFNSSSFLITNRPFLSRNNRYFFSKCIHNYFIYFFPIKNEIIIFITCFTNYLSIKHRQIGCKVRIFITPLFKCISYVSKWISRTYICWTHRWIHPRNSFILLSTYQTILKFSLNISTTNLLLFLFNILLYISPLNTCLFNRCLLCIHV